MPPFLARIKEKFAPLADEDVTNKKYVDGVFAALGARIDEIPAGGVLPPEPADTTPPTVSITASKTSANTGESVMFIVTASDNVGIVSCSFKFNGTAYTLNASNQTTVAMPSAAGTYTAEATATDDAGNMGAATQSIVVTTPYDLEFTADPTTWGVVGTIPAGFTGTVMLHAKNNPAISGYVPVYGYQWGFTPTSKPGWPLYAGWFACTYTTLDGRHITASNPEDAGLSVRPVAEHAVITVTRCASQTSVSGGGNAKAAT